MGGGLTGAAGGEGWKSETFNPITVPGLQNVRAELKMHGGACKQYSIFRSYNIYFYCCTSHDESPSTRQCEKEEEEEDRKAKRFQI